MSVFVQEVLSLLKRNFVKTTLNPTDDYFQFVRKGPLARAKASAGGFAPQGQSLLISAGSWLCSQTGPNGVGRFARVQKSSGNVSYVPVFTTPEGQCSWNTLKDSIITQDTGAPSVYIGKVGGASEFHVYGKAFVSSLTNREVMLAAQDGLLSGSKELTFGPRPGTAGTYLENRVSTIFGLQNTTINPPCFPPQSSFTLWSRLNLYGSVHFQGTNGDGSEGQIMVQTTCGRLKWEDKGSPSLQYGEIIIGYENPQPAPGTIVPAVGSFTSGALGTGNNNDVLTSGGPGGFPSWAPNPGINGSGTPFRLSAFNTSNTLIDSLLVQDNNLPIVDPSFATQTITNSGKWINTGTMKLLDVAQDATQEKVLVLDTSTGLVKFRFANSIGLTGTSTLRRVPLWSPDGLNIQSSLLIQSDMIQPPANYPVVDPSFVEQVLTNNGSFINEGNFENEGTTELVTVAQVPSEDVESNTQVLVRDPLNNGLVKYAELLDIGPGLRGWDVIDPTLGIANWVVDLGNGYMEVTTTPPSNRAIRPFDLANANEGYFVFVASASDVPKGFLLFTGVNGLLSASVRTTWSGDQTLGFPYIPNNLDSTGQFWAKGTAVKFHYILREDANGNQIIWWDACCEIKALNQCPVSTDTNFITPEDTTIGPLNLPSTDPDPNTTLTWLIVTGPPASEGTVTLDPSNPGQYTFVPFLNWYGTGSFTWKTNDGQCDSNIATTTYNVTAQCDQPQFAVSNGIGNACGAASTAPSYTGAVGGTYTWIGDYCDTDNPYTDVTLTAEYSTDNGATFISGLLSGTTLVKDSPAPYQFTFQIQPVPQGTLTYRFTLTDDVVGCSTQYIFSVGAILAILNKYEFQVSAIAASPTIQPSRTDYGLNTNLGMGGAEPGPYSNSASSTNWVNFNGTQKYIGSAGGGPAYWGGLTIKGKMLTNRNTVPSNMDTSGIPNNISVEGISPSGGTYGGIAGGATFQLVNMVASAPNPNPGSREIFVFADQIPADNLIALGQTIIFDAATLDTAFSAHVSSGFNFTGNLTCVIEEEDMAYPPRAIGAINLNPNGNTGHACNSGAFKLVATVMNSLGLREVFSIRRFSTSNTSLLNSSQNHYTEDTWVHPEAFIDGTSGNKAGGWTRERDNLSIGNNAPWVVQSDYVDLTRRGIARTQVNSIYNNNKSYAQANVSLGAPSDKFTTSGVARIPQNIIQQIASASSDGKVTFKIVGDTWIHAMSVPDDPSGQESSVEVTAVDSNGGITGAIVKGVNCLFNNVESSTSNAITEGTNGFAGVVTILIPTPGVAPGGVNSGYATATGVATTTNNNGTGLTVDITVPVPTTSALVPGSNYSVGAFTVTGGGGTGITGTIDTLVGTGEIATFTIINGGSGYSTSDVLTIVQSGGSGGSITLSTAPNGAISSLTLNNGGSLYAQSDAFTVVGGDANATGFIAGVGNTNPSVVNATGIGIGVVAGDIIYNVTAGTQGIINSVPTNDQVTVTTGIFPSGGETVAIRKLNQLNSSLATFTTNEVIVGDTVKNTLTGASTTVAALINETTLTLTSDIFNSATLYNDDYTIVPSSTLQVYDNTKDFSSGVDQVTVGETVMSPGGTYSGLTPIYVRRVDAVIGKFRLTLNDSGIVLNDTFRVSRGSGYYSRQTDFGTNVPANFVMKCNTGGCASASKAIIRFHMLGATQDPGQGIVVTDPNITWPFGERPSEVLAVEDPGSGYSVGDILFVSALDTYVANTHGDRGSFRMFHENAAGTNQEEIFNGGVFDPTNVGNGECFTAGDGTGVEVDLFNGTIVVV